LVSESRGGEGGLGNKKKCANKLWEGNGSAVAALETGRTYLEEE